MKTLFFIIFIFSISLSYGQTGSLNGKIIFNDTSKIFLDIFLQRSSKLVDRFDVVNGHQNFKLNNLPEGYYQLEINSFKYRTITVDSIHIIKDSTTTFTFNFPPPCLFKNFKKGTPVCDIGNHKDHIIPVVYGFPTAKMMKKARKQLIYLGGCIKYECRPSYYCTLHKKEL